MRHYPVFLDLTGRTIVVSGAGEVAVAKLRLLLKTEARIVVCGTEPDAVVRGWADEGRIELIEGPVEAEHVAGAVLVYGANDDAEMDARAAELGRAAGALANIVDNLQDSDFITPAIVDRDPVTVAIGTEGMAPVVARGIKARLEEMLPARLGDLVRIGGGFRGRVEDLSSKARRAFWSKFYFVTGPDAFAEGADAARAELERLLTEGVETRKGFVHLVGAGPGDPELLTMKARRLLHEADVVIHDRLVSKEILELARREATILEVGKKGFGPSWSQSDINALMIRHAEAGDRIVRLKGGDPSVFGRLDEEIDALTGAGIAYEVVPGVTAASAAVASIGQSLTKRGRNTSVRFLTGHDVAGFADQDWRALAEVGATAAIYMGVRASEFLRGRLMMHGAPADTPVTAVENASRPDQRVIATSLLDLPHALEAADPEGPVLLLLGIAPRSMAEVLEDARKVL